jgi:hypothetical protein
MGLKTEVTRLTDELHKARRQITKIEDKLSEAQGLKKFDPRLSFQPKPDRNKENSMVTPAKTSMAPPPTGKMSRLSTGSPLRVNRN